MKFLAPAIALFCLAGPAISSRSMNSIENAPSNFDDSQEGSEPFKHPKRWTRFKGRDRFQDRIICYPVHNRDKQRPRKKPQPSRKYVVEFTTRAYEGKALFPSTEEGPRVNFVSETAEVTFPQRACGASVDSAPSPSTFLVSIPQIVEQVTEKIRRTGRRRNPGRTMTMSVDDFCPSSLVPMVTCPRCGSHFRISVIINPLQMSPQPSCPKNRKRHHSDYFEDLDHGPVQKLGVGAPETAPCAMSNLGTMMICPRCGAILIVGVHIHESPSKPWPPGSGAQTRDDDTERELKENDNPG